VRRKEQKEQSAKKRGKREGLLQSEGTDERKASFGKFPGLTNEPKFFKGVKV